MKSINKKIESEQFYDRSCDFYDYKRYYKLFINEKHVGQLGNECRFLVKLIDSFQIEVNKKIINCIVLLI